MKKAILVLAVIASLVSCNGSSEPTVNDSALVSGDDSSLILPELTDSAKAELDSSEFKPVFDTLSAK